MRGRSITFRIDPTTRPMKDRTREALFNLLGGKLEGFVAIDLFAGSGILAFESLSRGADMAIAIELDRVACRELQASAAQLQVQNFASRQGDAFYYSESIKSWTVAIQSKPWCVYVCPPYRLWKTKAEACQKMIQDWCMHAPEGSLIAIEFEEPAPTEKMLPANWDWDVRTYRPAVLAIGCRLGDSIGGVAPEAID